MVKKKAEELEEMYNRLLQELVGNPPLVTNRYAYDLWYQYKAKVESCAQETIAYHPDYDYDLLKEVVKSCAQSS
ncbi:hypothetical protein BFU36_05560 [Sulfolobus sp. A20]|uniref:hypothetical protein n=1 Tax=Sulfolobaceae TaxID=118883 RepID=UPI000845DB75|nr:MULTISPECIES: hypothetical protein [unclassified Sulfolobus]TRM73062.1 hypothetical protein DJ532_15755 [Sulfolobus sp. A20-N-F8]TRM79202.1 hypothetical protein DJ528_02395 [Sulfolobus sp. B5]TRM88600.1 hypothetical protein DJ529_04750 [Sulfolobus sp. C3]TRN02970.1 hypothetical protein DJ527_02995 [Sulfolobus sp. F1]TRN04241.1 hypothetical protein DJ530_01330 [Sulfolobus sp. E1]